MRACVQRVSRCRVTIAHEVVSHTGPGMLVLLGVSCKDTAADAKALAERVAALRIFEDENSKMNLALSDCGGAMTVVSQFTLYGDCRRGRRPSFIAAAPPEMAQVLYMDFVQAVRQLGIEVSTGVFRADMQVELVNDGPVTLWLDSEKSI